MSAGAEKVEAEGGTSSSAVNGVGKGGTSKKDCSSPHHCCSDDGRTEDGADLDDRIRHALDELESPSRKRKGFKDTNGYLLPGAVRTTSVPLEPGGGAPAESDEEGSAESDSDSDCEEGSRGPSVMGYMPLPQDPDTEEDGTLDCLAVSGVGNQVDSVDQEGGEAHKEEKQQVQEVVRDAVPEAASVDLKKGIVHAYL